MDRKVENLKELSLSFENTTLKTDDVMAFVNAIQKMKSLESLTVEKWNINENEKQEKQGFLSFLESSFLQGTMKRENYKLTESFLNSLCCLKKLKTLSLYGIEGATRSKQF